MTILDTNPTYWKINSDSCIQSKIPHIFFNPTVGTTQQKFLSVEV